MNRLTRLKYWIPQYRINLALATPVILSQMGQVVVQLADNVMVGWLGALPLAAVSFGNAIFTLFMFWGNGLTLGLTPLVGEVYARGDYRSAGRYLRNSISLYTLIGIVLFILLMGVGHFLPYFGQDPSVVEVALPYYRYVAWSIIPLMLFGAFKQFLEGIGNTKTGMVVVLTANAINILLNYLLIYGKLGLPEMGASGAGLATLISRICMVAFILAYFSGHTPARRYFRFFARAGAAWIRIKQLWKVGFPIAMQMLLEVSAFALTLVMMGWIGIIETAAHQIVMSMGTLIFMLQLGIASATTILVSHGYGRGDLRTVRRAATASYHLSLAAAVISMLSFFALRNLLPHLFTGDEAVIAVASGLFIMLGLYQIPDGLQVISIGILRGMQDVRPTMIVAFLAYIVINLPVGYFCAFILGWGAPGLWVGFIVGLSTAAVLLHLRYRKKMRKLTIAQQRTVGF